MARACSVHAGRHCWRPLIGDKQAVEDYGLTNHMHVQVTDSEMLKWVNEVVR